MTQADKELLLKDFCARLPYGVKVKIKHYDNVWELLAIYTNGTTYATRHVGYPIETYFEDCKPYLFPLSSMTEEQQDEFDKIYADDMQVVANSLKNRLDGQPYESNFGHYRHIDWLNAHHFDYRALIEKGLAIDVTGLNIY